LKTCQKKPIFKDILFFRKEFDGVMPLKSPIDTNAKKEDEAFTLRKMEIFKTIEEISKTRLVLKFGATYQASSIIMAIQNITNYRSKNNRLLQVMPKCYEESE
jgi:hypothetical protein